MAVTIDVGNVYITTGTLQNASSQETSPFTKIEGGVTVCIKGTTKVDYVMANQLIARPIPITPRNIGVDTPFVLVKDLKMIAKSLIIQGVLPDEKSERAITKRDLLIAFMDSAEAL